MANHYINNKEFEKIIIQYQKAQKVETPQSQIVDLQNKLADLFYLLAENILKGFKFKLIDTDDALQEGVMICFIKLDRFEATKGGAFNYYTTCILNHYRQLYRGAKVYNDLKRKYQDHIIDKIPEIYASTMNDNQTKVIYRKRNNEI